MADNFFKAKKGINFEKQAAEPAIISGQDGRVYYDDSLKSLRLQKNDVWSKIGSGSGTGINFILNPDAETDTTGYNLYADAPATTPVDGTGGAPVGVTFVKTTTPSEVLYELGSFKLSKDASNRQGMGASYDFQISLGYRNRSQTVNFIYQNSANFSYGDGTTASPSDISVFIYDVDNSTIVPLSQNYLDGSGVFVAKFDPIDVASENYRLIFHISTTNALAYDTILDQIVVGPNTFTVGAAITDWKPYTPTFQGFGAAINPAFWYRRNGQNVDIFGNFQAGTTTGVEARISLPPGMVIDLLNEGGTDYTIVGNIDQNTATANDRMALALSGNTYINASNANTANSLLPQLGTIFSTGAGITLNVSVPILGWSSNLILSSESTNRLITFSANKTTTQSIPLATPTVVVFNQTLVDAAAGYNSSNGRYTVKESGNYIVNASVSYAANVNGTRDISISVNGTSLFEYLETSPKAASIAQASVTSSPIRLNAGDYIEIITSQAGTGGALNLSGDAEYTFFGLFKIATPQTIAYDGPKFNSMVDVQTPNGFGSTNTVIRRFTTILTNQGIDISYSDSATLGGSFTINTSGIYAITYSEQATSNGDSGLSRNSNQLTTSINTITASHRLAVASHSAGNAVDKNAMSWVGHCLAGDVIRAHVDVPASFGVGATINRLTVTRIG